MKYNVSEINFGSTIFCLGKVLVFKSSNSSFIGWAKALGAWWNYLSAGGNRLET
jgi:hypothetical protein